MDKKENMPSPPGELIRFLMGKKHMSKEELRDHIRLSYEDFERLLTGELDIRREEAEELNEVLGCGVDFWLNIEWKFRHQLWQFWKERGSGDAE